jgi:hypothetical protein
MTSVAAPICGGCTRLIGDLKEPRCQAFEKGVPWEILLSQKDHREPYPGDKGIRFEPKDKAAADYAESMFKKDAS